MGIEDTATVGSPQGYAEGAARTSAVAALAAREMQHLRASQARSGGSISRRGRQQHGGPRDAVNEDVLDFMISSSNELVEHARAVIPDDQIQRPAPRNRGIHEWLGEHTPDLDDGVRLATEGMLYAQFLRARILAGEPSVIRPHPCLSCGRWMLKWYEEMQVAVCLSLRCRSEDGRPSRFTLHQIAMRFVESENLTNLAAT